MAEPLFIWSDDYLIGVEELDFEHKDLFNCLNDLHEELKRHEDRDKIEGCLGEIHVRVIAHFALEERYMLDKNYPEYVQHKKEHEDFLEVIADIIEKFKMEDDFKQTEILESRLQKWIIDHITTSDHDLGTVI